MEKLFQFGWKRLVRYFMQGLLAILPLALTVAIISWFFTFLKGIFGPQAYIGERLSQFGVNLYRETGLKGDEGVEETFLGYLIGIGSVLIIIFCLGVFLELGAKRFLQDLTDRLVRRIPIIGSLYGSMKQLVDLFDQPEEAEIKAMSVVFCHFSEAGGTGVLALMPSSEKILIEEVEYNVVMIPTAPVPFGGGLIFVPAKQVKKIDMSVDNFISIYVSMGVTTPEFMKQNAERAKQKLSEDHKQPEAN